MKANLVFHLDLGLVAVQVINKLKYHVSHKIFIFHSKSLHLLARKASAG